jgi:uncharacterized membrane protein
MNYQDFGRMRASTADRERAVDVLKAAYTEGRLAKDEYDQRVAQAYGAATYNDLHRVTADLPGGSYRPVVPADYRPVRVHGTNGLAIASFACGLAEFFTLGISAIPAIVLGHMARRQIERTGEDGNGLAVTGLALGYTAVALAAVLAVVAVIAITVTAVHGGASHAIPGPAGGLPQRPPSLPQNS